MKKIVAMMLALMLVLVSVSAMASSTGYEVGGTPTTGTPNENTPIALGSQITFDKDYTITAVGTNIKLPKHSVTFTGTIEDVSKSTLTKATAPQTLTIAYTNPAASAEVAVTDAEVTAGAKAFDDTITITIPNFTSTGIYIYKIHEAITSGSALPAGVTLADDVFMKITVIQDPDSSDLVVGGISFRSASDPNNDETTADGKLDAITNEYETWELNVDKIVTGNMGETDKPFEVTIDFEATGDEVAGTITYTTVDADGTTVSAESGTIAATAWANKKAQQKINLKAGYKVTFDNIPTTIKYTVTETDYTGEGYDAAEYSGDAKTDTVSASGTKNVHITNNKEITIDTGIALDAVPYMMIMAIALMGVAMMIVRRREEM